MNSHNVFTSISSHSEHVAADESAAQLMINGRLAPRTKEAISLALDQPHEQWEYGFSTAIDPGTGARHYSNPTRGNHKATAPTGPPNSIINNQLSDTTVFSDILNEPTRESAHRYKYKGLIGVHTHPLHDGAVGLSATDLQDDIFAGDHLSTQHLPFEIYRAKAAIVFTDDISRLPISQTNQADLQTSNTLESIVSDDSEGHLLESRPQVRPWLHLLERTPEAVSLSESRAKAVHYETLNSPPNGSQEEQYQAMRSRIKPYISELIIPLSP